ncbi:MAG TPA: matrixin family metalloprotease [Polyangiaceae bacterium]|nr:matrixin family metalloprotease [Polyangiaceae bacterium]
MYPKHDPRSNAPHASFDSSKTQNSCFHSAKRRGTWCHQATKLAVIALTALATGCLGDPIYVDERFTPEEERTIQAAAGLWSTATNGNATVDFIFGQRVDLRDTGRRVMVRAGERAAENAYELFRDGDPGGRHESWDSEVIVIVPERMDGIDLEYVVTHELGHHFGVHHVTDETAIMYFQPNPRSAHCLTREDLMAYCGANACNSASMRACDSSILP